MIPAELPSLHQIEQSVQLAFEEATTLNPPLADLVRELSLNGRIVIFGGFVRDRIHSLVHRAERRSRDIDLVVCGTLDQGAPEALRTNFGGHRRSAGDNLTVDYWELEKTYAFRFNKVPFPAIIENLPRTTVFTLNACLFEIDAGRLIEHQAIADIAARRIAFNCRDYLDVFPVYQAFRAIDLAQRLDYTLDSEVSLFVRAQIDRSTLQEFLHAVQIHRREATEEQIARMRAEYGSP